MWFIYNYENNDVKELVYLDFQCNYAYVNKSEKWKPGNQRFAIRRLLNTSPKASL